MLVKKVVENEFLVRWNPDGSLSGAHIKFLETITDGEVIISQKQTMAAPVAMAGQTGFPLDAILTAVQSGAIIAFDAEVASHVATKAAKDDVEASLQKAQGECSRLQQLLDQEVAQHATTTLKLLLAESKLRAAGL